MLFDLRGRGRRRTVQTIYLGLALLMGIGLVGFGIGGGLGSGGLFNSLGTGGTSSSDAFQKAVTNARRQTRRQPANPAAWAALTKALYQQAGTGENYDTTSSSFTTKGQVVLGQAATAWQRYLTLKPNTANVALANEMVQAYEGQGGLNEAAQAVQALQIIIAHSPQSWQQYASLAEYAYVAGNTRQGDLAAAKAIALAPEADKAQLRSTFASIKATSTPTVTTAPATTSTATTSSAAAATPTLTLATTSSTASVTTAPAKTSTTPAASVSTTSTTATPR